MTGRSTEHRWRESLLLGSEERGLVPLHLLEDADAREEFGVEGDSFAAVLVGKDGTEKSRFERPVEAGEVFRLIGETPMRREMERGS